MKTEKTTSVTDWRVEVSEAEEKYAFGKLLRIIKGKLRHQLFNGEMSATLTRINLDCGDYHRSYEKRIVRGSRI